MEIITYVWEHYLYIPLFNLLIVLYTDYAFYRMALAIIIMTIMLRIVLLPFSIMSELNKNKSARIRKEIAQIEKDFVSDHVQRKLAIRKYLKQKKIRPWYKAVLLSVQFLVLLLLYQVFVGGIYTAEKIHLIYPTIIRPDFINTQFLWFDIAKPDYILTFIVAVYLFVEQLVSSWIFDEKMTRREQIFMLIFPAFVFVILVILPSVKSLFVLTSLIISTIITVIGSMIRLAIINSQNAKKA